MANAWSADDYSAVALAIDGGTYTASTSNWKGMHTRGPEYEPATNEDPVVYCIWALEPQEHIRDFGPDSRPIVRYALVFEVHRQKFASRGHVLVLEGEIRTALKAADGNNGVQYDWKGGSAVPIGESGAWEIEQLQFTTHGVGT